MRRFEAEGEAGLVDRSRRPHLSPNQTPEEIEQKVIEARQKTAYDRTRLAPYLRSPGVQASSNTIHHILRRIRGPLFTARHA